MRVAGVILAALIAVGCARSIPGVPQVAPAPPGAGAAVDEVIAWVEAGNPANRDDFDETEASGGAPTPLGSDVAFRSPRDLPDRTLDGCITHDGHGSAGRKLSCLTGLSKPPEKPDGVQGQWIGNWVNFDGSTVTVGGLHGDPGPFIQGRGKPLPYGDRLRFGDYQCRSEPGGIYCVNYPHHSAVLLGETVVVFGCRQQPDHPRSVGEQYDCGH